MRAIPIGFAIFLFAASAPAQVSTWQLGGDGLQWSANDTVNVLVDFDSTPGAIRPVYIDPDRNIIQLLDDWSNFRQPKELGYIDGERPRIWRWNEGTADPSVSGVSLIDGDSTSYNSASSEGIDKQFFTLDLAVPVPARRFSFFTPSVGFRADGTPLSDDATPAYLVSVQEETSDIFAIKGNHPLERIVADVDENFETQVKIDLPVSYVRFIRFARQISLVDAAALNRCGSGCLGQGNQALAFRGSIADFEVFGQGVPKRVTYKSKIIDLGVERNFGRLFWEATPLRRVDGVEEEVEGAQASVSIEIRTGRDSDPNVYQEFTVTGGERVVSREVYENDLRAGFARTCATCDLVARSPRPGLRASIDYDSENWTFWSPPFTEPGQALNLRSGSFLQLNITLHSDRPDDFVRLDELRIEQAPVLARRVLGEVARLDDPRPRGFAQVELGRMTDFVYETRAVFENADEAGFDALRVRTGNPTLFKSLQLDGVESDPASVDEESDGLVVRLPRRIERGHSPTVRIVFAAEVFDLATEFEGQAIDSAVETLPQPVVSGDAGESLSTNSLRVLAASGSSPGQLQDLRFSSPVFTPNGDGANDELRLDYALFSLPEPVPAALNVYGLDGNRLARLELGRQDSGQQHATWDGRDADGTLLPPGLYLLEVDIDSEDAQAGSLRPIGLAY